MPAFQLDPRIAAASVAVADLALCHVRLQDDRRWPWLVLVPRRPDLVELDDLSETERSQVMREISLTGEAVRVVGAALGRDVHKLNTGALGNVVSQLHIHVVGRRRDDPAWPGPVWGFGATDPLEPEARQVAVAAAASILTGS